MGYDITLLPLPRFNDPSLTVVAARSKWEESLRLVDQLRNAPVTLGWQLQQALDNLYYYIALGLRQIDVFYNRGGTGFETVASVEGLELCRQKFMSELTKVQALYANWLQETSTGSVQATESSVQGFGDMTTDLIEFAKPKDTSQLFLGLLLAGGFLLFSYGLKR